MASATIKKTCAKCNKGGGTAMCYGCEQAFCTKHFIEHRQELSQQMDSIGQEHDVFRRDLTNEQGTHPLLACINQWEQESIIKIQAAAKSARTDLKRLLNEAKNNLKTSVSKMTEELQSSRESDDYTELDIKKWTDQLQGFRKMLDSPTTVKIDYENDARSVVRLIKVTDQQSSNSSYQIPELSQSHYKISHNLETSVSERFIDSFGKVMLAKDGLVAKCLDGNTGWSCASGVGRYSSGVHCVRFRIEQFNSFHLFLGIVNSSEKMRNDILDSTSSYGWWDPNHFVVNGKAQRQNTPRTIEIGDDVSMMLDCDSRRIQLEHHRTQKIVDIPIDLQLCAFPWKIVISFREKDDCVRILH